ncbi:MAG: Kelch repeat-containing protein, partial [Acidimicrobiales bacterium]
ARPVAAPAADRSEATATLLADGTVLAAGGAPEVGPAEVFDPGAGTWSPTGPMVQARVGHTATALPDGRVLVAGGVVAGESTTAAEIYDPANRTWAALPPMAQPRSFHTATLLRDGRLLVAGGQAGGHGPFWREAEVFDPATATGAWGPAGVIEQGRSFHAAALLTDGRVLVTGGQGDPHGTSLRDGAAYDPAANAWSVVPQLMAVGRSGHSATLLRDGTVLLAGGTPQRQGDNDGDQIQASAEVFDPVDESFRPAPAMASARAFHAALALPSGRVLVVGGQSAGKGGVVAATRAELFDGATHRWVPAGTVASTEGPGRLSAVLLAGPGCGRACGSVLVVDAEAQLLASSYGDLATDDGAGGSGHGVWYQFALGAVLGVGAVAAAVRFRPRRRSGVARG